MWRITVENLRNLTDAFAQHERPQFIEPLLRLPARFGRSPVDFQIRRKERAKQPGPNGALMIRAIAAEWIGELGCAPRGALENCVAVNAATLAMVRFAVRRLDYGNCAQ